MQGKTNKAASSKAISAAALRRNHQGFDEDKTGMISSGESKTIIKGISNALSRKLKKKKSSTNSAGGSSYTAIDNQGGATSTAEGLTTNE